MTGEMHTISLSPQDMAILADSGGGVAPHSPFAPFVGMSSGVDRGPGSPLDAMDEAHRAVISALRHPATRIRVIAPGPSETLVQYYYGSGRAGDGLIGCWLEGEGLRVSFPWSGTDVAALTSQVVLGSPATEITTEPLVLGSDGLAAFASVIDTVRSRLLDSLAQRDPTMEYRFVQNDIAAQLEKGWASVDPRWLVTLLAMVGMVTEPRDDVLARGFNELTAADIVFSNGAEWTPGPTLFTYASWWRNPLPAVSHEITRFSGGRVVDHAHRLAIRGDGPICVIDRTGSSPNGSSVSVATPAPADYFDELVRSIDEAQASNRRWVYVVAPEAVRGLDNTERMVGIFQPGIWYELVRVEGAWAHVSDPAGPLEGWVPVNALHTEESDRREDRSESVATVVPGTAGWAVSHVVPSAGLRAWAAPDPAADVVADLVQGVELEVIERRADWAYVRAENGWAAWVDGRLLTPVPKGEPPPLPPPLTEEAPAAIPPS